MSPPDIPIAAPLELWGGLECTVARVGDQYRDQMAETGHRDRPEDLDRIASLGIRTMRYPILWETVAPEAPDRCDWRWHDERLGRLRELGVRVIAGLIHHGSGPRYTDLLDPAFPRLFSRHAARVARRYPWLDLYTPVNEPLTTARFSALYGHWYPHERSYGPFLRALVNQCRATVLAMRAIRRINPDAKLVQTEDLGKTFSTAELSYQAEHENERRWLSFDLLFGRVDRAHPWWGLCTSFGVPEADLSFLRRYAARPDLIGINHYLTSERYLDHRSERYPEHLRGGNGRHAYADVEAVRIGELDEEVGLASRLAEVWQRYRTPIAVTEAHHGCSRDEQLRWLHDVWTAAESARRAGADVRAVTIWSMLGTVDWNVLLTRQRGIYEPGAFDVRAPQPRPTALAKAARDLAATGRFDHPVLDRPGWWRRAGRSYLPGERAPERPGSAARPLLFLGDLSPALDAFSRIAAVRGLDTVAVKQRDAADPARVLRRHRPWAVLDLRQVERSVAVEPSSEGESCDFAAACASSNIRYATCSDVGLFDGAMGRPAVERDAPSRSDRPGLLAAMRERDILQACPEALVIRTGPLFGPWHRESQMFRLLSMMAHGSLVGCDAAVTSPTYLPDLAHVALDLLIDGDSGLRHVANHGGLSGVALVHELAARSGLADLRAVESGYALDLSLATVRDQLMPPLASALDRFVADCEPDWRVVEGAISIAAE